ncbi:MAG: hemolysin family protein [Thiohalobacterales bacterium]|nr:hemolysin family protein [Thiohalobacterales bacterium]
MDIALIILAMVGLLLLQGFFSGSEIALVHADRLKLHHLDSQGHRGAEMVLKAFHKPEVLLGTTLVGTNLSLVTLTTLGTILMIRLFGEHGDLYAFLIYTPLFLIMGEVVPKSVYQQKADQFAPVIIYPLRFFSWLFYPVVFIFSSVARGVARLAGVKIAQRELFVNREQIRTVVEMAEQGADIDVFDRDRIIRVTAFADTTVGDAMIPISDMTMISRNRTTREAIELARSQAHFRLPVYEGEHNQITGVVTLTLWDLMDPDLANRPLAELVSPPLYVTSRQLLDELLPQLQQRHDHMAVVIDEFGTAVGMITLEDILEEVVGEVVNVGYTFEGHLPRHRYIIKETGEGAFEMDGRLPLSELSDTLEVQLPSLDAHTVGGMVIAHLRHIPKAGEFVQLEGFRFTVLETGEPGIHTLRVERID